MNVEPFRPFVDFPTLAPTPTRCPNGSEQRSAPWQQARLAVTPTGPPHREFLNNPNIPSATSLDRRRIRPYLECAESRTLCTS